MRLFSAQPHKVSALDSEDLYGMSSSRDTAPQNLGTIFSLPEHTLRALALPLAALHGVIARIRDIHMPLISVCPKNVVNQVEMDPQHES